MTDTIDHPDLERFLDAARRGGARAVGIREVDEVRPVRHADGSVVVGPVLRCELTALAGRTIHRVTVHGTKAADVETPILAAGFPVRRSRGNIT